MARTKPEEPRFLRMPASYEAMETEAMMRPLIGRNGRVIRPAVDVVNDPLPGERSPSSGEPFELPKLGTSGTLAEYRRYWDAVHARLAVLLGV